MLTCGGYSSWGGFSACTHSLRPLLCGAKDRSSIICQHNSQSSRQDLKLSKPLSAFTNPLPTPGQSHAFICRVSHSPWPLMPGDSQWQPQSSAHLGLVPAHTPSWPSPWHQPLPYLPRGLLCSCMKLGQIKPTQGLTGEMNLGNKAEKRDLGKTRSPLSPSETSRAAARWRSLVLSSPRAAPFRLIG